MNDAAHTIHTPYDDDEARWQAVLRRDVVADGQFFVGVTTTGVFCRPSCPARKPKREHVRFFTSTAAAEAAGFRACKRCRPLEASADAGQTARIVQACRRIEDADEPPSLAGLAAEAGLSLFHFHRLFKKLTGVTPKDYANACKARRMRDGLGRAASVTEAIYAAGYSSSSRFYEQADTILGMKARTFRSGGKGVTMQYAVRPCWLGHVLIAGTERGICAILFADDPDALLPELRRRFSAAEMLPADSVFAGRAAEAVAALERPQEPWSLPLDILGTAFQRRIWMALRDIPVGTTATYTDIAERIGAPDAVRAVAGACAANPIAVAVPCHRVIRKDGALAGYRWGLERKHKLLEREANQRKKDIA